MRLERIVDNLPEKTPRWLLLSLFVMAAVGFIFPFIFGPVLFYWIFATQSGYEFMTWLTIIVGGPENGILMAMTILVATMAMGLLYEMIPEDGIVWTIIVIVGGLAYIGYALIR